MKNMKKVVYISTQNVKKMKNWYYNILNKKNKKRKKRIKNVFNYDVVWWKIKL